jgi:energy-coupling factor transporter ATP-binding protein EcfA2
LAYFGQHSTAELDLEETPIEFMGRQFPDESSGTLRNHLAKTSIVGQIADTRLERLSFSQRSCVVFAKLTFVCPHLLILDEPTNFLDLESVDSLISACNKYKGALLLVSHNRDFLRKCAREFLSVVPGKFELFKDMKQAENSTYTFIQEMEEGGKINAAAALAKGGGTVQKDQDKRAGANEEKKADSNAVDGVKVVTIGSGGGSSAAAVKKPAAATQVTLTYAANEKCQALWTDGKWYAAVIKKVEAPGKYLVTYTQYGNSVSLPVASLKKAAPAAAAPAKK